MCPVEYEPVTIHRPCERSSQKSVDFVLVVSLAAAFFLVADWRRRHAGALSEWLRPDLTHELGAECDCIAGAICTGRGFSDPFNEPTGPTAWMPPVFPCFIAGLYQLTGDSRAKVIEAVVLVNFLVIVLTGVIVTAQARRLGRRWLGHTILFMWLLSDFFELFQRTHDTWLVLLAFDLLFIGVCRSANAPSSIGTQCLWGIFGGLCALCGPVVGFVWASTTTVFWLPRPVVERIRHPITFLRDLRPLIVTALVSIAVIMPWLIRNRVVFGKWIPIKSNAVYEIWQSQVLDDDGVLDSLSAYQQPWGYDGPQRARYREVGETSFVAEFWEPIIDSVTQKPLDVLVRVRNRCCAACIYYVPFMHGDENRVWPMRFKRFLFPIPFLSLLVVMSLRSRREPALVGAICIYLFGLLPYAAISYYERYAAPLVLAKTIIVIFGVDTLATMQWSKVLGLGSRDDRF